MERIKRTFRWVLEWRWWKKLLFPHPALTLFLSCGSAAGLVWVFAKGKEQTIVAYFLYPLSFYALVTLILQMWRWLPWILRKTREDRLIQWVTQVGGGSVFDLGFYSEQIINFCYGGFKILSGIAVRSAWIGADGIYNFTQGVIQLYQLLRHRRSRDMMSQWKAYRSCGWMMIFVNLTMTGMVFQMIHLGRHEDNTQISMIATAAFTFYKLTKAIVKMARDRKHKNPVESSVIFLDFGQGLYNLFVLQVGLLWTFGQGDHRQYYLMNTLTGFAVCILVCGIGVYMLWRSRRDMRQLSDE